MSDFAPSPRAVPEILDDCLAGRQVVVTRGQESFAGVACGLADDGALLVDRDGSIVPVVAGDVSLRAPG